MDQLHKKTTFLIIEFDEINQENQSVVELIPRSWASELHGELFCRYPNTTNQTKMNKWIKSRKEPEDQWDNYPVLKIIGEARNYDQGRRRLDRYLRDEDVVQSTDAESTSTVSTNLTISRKRLANSLRQTNPLPVLNGDLNITGILADVDTIIELDESQANENLENQCQQCGRNIVTADQLRQGFMELEMKLSRKIDSAKRSILYDLEKKTNILQINQNLLPAAPIHQISAAREKLPSLPISDLNDFLLFDDEIKNDATKKNALKTLFTSLIVGLKDVKHDIAEIIPAVITKSVQLKYSGFGRQTKSAGSKLNFSGTALFGCIKEVLEEKWAHHTEPLQIGSKISRWLSGAPDRERGRRERNNNNNDL